MHLTTLALLLLSQAEGPPIVLPGEARSAALLYRDFRQHAEAGKWDDATTEFNALLARPLDLAPLTASQSLQSRWLANRSLAVFPAAWRERWRDQRQPAAQQNLDAALARGDEAVLRRVVEEQFGTPASARAIDWLGDLAIDRGDFDLAACWYRLLLPASKDGLALPDPPLDQARPAAKLLLARILANKHLGPSADLAPNLGDDLAAFAKQHPAASGTLLGREGKYHDLLGAVARDREFEVPPGAGWPSFGGGPERGRVIPGGEPLVDRIASLTRKPLVRLSLDTRTAIPGLGELFGAATARGGEGMAIHPAIADDVAYFADSQFLTSVDLKTGRVRGLFDAVKAVNGVDPERSFPAADLFRASVTVVGDAILSRHGVVGLRDPKADPKAMERLESVLVCLTRAGDGTRVRWTARSSPHDGSMFEGTALAAHGRAYIAATRVKAERTTTAIHCYALDAHGEAEPLWVRDVCETRELCNGPVRRLHHLISLAGPNVVYASHSGAVVALDAFTGQRSWAVRYPSSPRVNRLALPGTEGQPGLRDLSPALFADGAVFVAPGDSETLFCLDPWTGAIRWQRDRIQAVHLLGAHRDVLIFTTADGLRAVGTRDGADRWTLPDSGRLPPAGRGQVVGGVVLWPTTRGVVAIHAEEGRVVGRLDRVPIGNLAWADGVLASADRTTLTIFRGDKLQPQVRAAVREVGEKWPVLEKVPDVKIEPVSVPEVWSLGPAIEWDRGEVALPGTPWLMTVQPGKGGSVLRQRGEESAVVRWSLNLPFVPVWSARREGWMVLAGAGGMACITAGGKSRWQVDSREGVDAFRLVGERLFVRVGRSRLRVIDAHTGATQWEYASPDAGLPLPSPGGEIGPDYLVGSRFVRVRIPGRAVWIDGTTGRVVERESAPSTLDVDDALSLSEAADWVLAERGSVVRRRLEPGQAAWSWDVPGKTTLRHESNRLLGVGGSVWVQVPLNIGHEIHRLDLASGKPLSPLPLLIRAEPFDLASGCVAGGVVVLIEPPEVVGRGAGDGAVKWRTPLPVGPARFRLERMGDEVVLIPATSRVVGTEFRCLIGTVEWMMKGVPSAGALTDARILRIEPGSGRSREVGVPTGMPTPAWSWRAGLQPYLRPEARAIEREQAAGLALLPTPDGWRLTFGARCWAVK